MLEDGLFEYKEISVEELIKSQTGNLSQKKKDRTRGLNYIRN